MARNENKRRNDGIRADPRRSIPCRGSCTTEESLNRKNIELARNKKRGCSLFLRRPRRLEGEDERREVEEEEGKERKGKEQETRDEIRRAGAWCWIKRAGGTERVANGDDGYPLKGKGGREEGTGGLTRTMCFD